MTQSADCTAHAVQQHRAAQSSRATLRYERAGSHDASALVAFFRAHREVSFCDWQDETVVRNALSRDTTLAFVARLQKEQIAGAVIAGVMGLRGTVNHIAVDPDYRNLGIGRSLIERVRAGMRDKGVHRLFLFVTAGNAVAHRFWTMQGFGEVAGESTYEVDL
jgi:ribosomal protein S18 acetylase RimI-like enzyme